MDVVWDNRELLWQGLKYTFKLFAVVVVLGTLAGHLFGIGLLYGNWRSGCVLRAYVDVIRGMPLDRHHLPDLLRACRLRRQLSARSSRSSLALSIFAAAHMAEIVRGVGGSIPGRADRRRQVARPHLLATDPSGSSCRRRRRS